MAFNGPSFIIQDNGVMWDVSLSLKYMIIVRRGMFNGLSSVIHDNGVMFNDLRFVIHDNGVYFGMFVGLSLSHMITV